MYCPLEAMRFLKSFNFFFVFSETSNEYAQLLDYQNNIVSVQHLIICNSFDMQMVNTNYLENIVVQNV